MDPEYRGLSDEPIARPTLRSAPEIDQVCEDPDARFHAAICQLLPILALATLPLMLITPYLGFALLVAGPLFTGLAYAANMNRHPFVAAAARQVFYFQVFVSLAALAGSGILLLAIFVIVVTICLTQAFGGIALLGIIVPLCLLFFVVDVVFPIMAAMRCMKGHLFVYPVTSRWAYSASEVSAGATAEEEAPPPLL